MYKVGDTYEEHVIFSQAKERAFTELTGDINPIHWDTEAAAQAGYPAPIVHGMLAACMIGKVIGVDFPGKGTVIVDRYFQFLRPLFVDTPYVISLKITEIEMDDAIGNIKFKIKDTNNKICLIGSTHIKNTEQFSN